MAGTAQGARGRDGWAGPGSGKLVNAVLIGLFFTLQARGTLRRCSREVGPVQCLEAQLKGGAEAAISAFQ